MMAIKIQQLYREEEVGLLSLSGYFVGRTDMYVRDGLQLSGKSTAVFSDELSAAVNSGVGSITNIFFNQILFQLEDNVGNNISLGF